MAEFRKLIITTAGFDFLTQAVKDNTAIAFSGVVLAARNYTDEEIATLATLADPMQTITNLGIVKPSPETIQITAMVSNSAAETGYSYSSIGLFAKNANGEEVLFAVSGSNSPGVIPPNTSLFSARLELLLTLSNAEQITFTVDDKIISGTHGIYVGSGDMPEGYDVQIDPEGEALLLDNAMSDDSENVPKTKVVKAYVDSQAANAAQDAVDAFAQESTSYPGCFYRTVNGVTEWLNPPMMLGVEYRTVERYQGEPVYVKMFNLGKITVAEGSRSIYPNISSVSHLMGLEVHSLNPDTQRSYAYGLVTSLKIYAGTDPNYNVYLNVQRFDIDVNEEVYATVKYTKTTDSAG